MTTRLGLYGGPRTPYGAFAPKSPASGVTTEEITRLGLYGGPRSPYGGFAPKTPGGVIGVNQVTRLGMYGGPRFPYGVFNPKTGGDVVEVGGGSGGRGKVILPIRKPTDIQEPSTEDDTEELAMLAVLAIQQFYE